MKVSDAVEQRSSIRAFLDRSVENSLIENLLQKSSRAASGGNLQPWKVYVINNSAMNDFLEFQTNWTEPEVPAYDIYPPKLKEPYRTSRYELGEQMYELLGIGRDNKDARLAQVMQNFRFSSGQPDVVVVTRDCLVSAGSESARSNAFVIGNNERKSCWVWGLG